MSVARATRGIIVVCLFNLVPALTQQVTGSISGSVHDSSGLALEHAILHL